MFSFCMQTKLSCYQLKIHCYKMICVTREQKPIVDTQNRKKGIKHPTMENNQTTKEDIKRGRKEQRDYKIEDNKQDGNSKSLPVNNYFKCKWIKHPSQRHRVAKWINLKIQTPIMYCL